MKVLLVVGARPNFVKVAPIVRALRSRGHDTVLVHTGQHYDASMSVNFFVDLSLPEPDHFLGVGAGSHAEQTAKVMLGFDPVLLQERPAWVVVVGDVNSTLAAALVVAKRRDELGCRLAHVEAGLRSDDWRMPEEVNRVLTDRVADLLLTHSPEAEGRLIAEGIEPGRVVFVGNVMIDSLFAALAEAPTAPPSGVSSEDYGLLTLHRPSNVDDAEQLRALLAVLTEVSERLRLIWPVHPRTRDRLAALNWTPPTTITLSEPVGYLAMCRLLDGARLVLTDSGGVQEESTALGIPCITLRESTERPITVREGTNRLVPWPVARESALAVVNDALAAARSTGSRSGRPRGWDGRAADRIVQALEAHSS